jgi:DNA ligase (NAD+)
MNLTEMKAFYVRANTLYNNSEKTIMSDAEFDALEKKIRTLDPKWKALRATGAKVDKKIEVKLDELMPSLAKVYPEAFNKWRLKQKTEKFLEMAKLDGGSLQLTCKLGKPVKLATRGNGIMGGDISFLIPHLNLPKKIPVQKTVVLRMEALMHRKVFAKKYADDYENARNTVNGWLNRMKPHAGLKDVRLVVLGIYDMPLAKGLDLADEWKFDTVPRKVSKLQNAVEATTALAKFKAECEYEIDGLVLCDPMHVFAYADSDRPKWVAAFKNNTDELSVEAKVKRIIWQDSRNSLLIPKIEIEPIRIGGTTVTYCTAHNAKWMADRGIGPGAVVRLVRSGDVIPKIVGVFKKGKFQPPTVKYTVEGVHFVATERSKESMVREIHNFMSKLGIEFLASKTIAQLYDFGLDEPFAYVSLHYRSDAKYFAKEYELGTKTAEKIWGEFDRVFDSPIPMILLMVASNCFDVGIGERKLKKIEVAYGPDCWSGILNTPHSQLKFDGIKGIGDTTAQLIADGIYWFKPFLRQCLNSGITIAKHKDVKAKLVSNKLKNVFVTFTGYRNPEHEKFITENGGQVVTMGNKTRVLLFKEGGKSSSKIDKARDAGLMVTTFEAFKKGIK